MCIYKYIYIYICMERDISQIHIYIYIVFVCFCASFIGVRGSLERDISSLRALGPGGGQISRVVHVSVRTVQCAH